MDLKSSVVIRHEIMKQKGTKGRLIGAIGEFDLKLFHSAP